MSLLADYPVILRTRSQSQLTRQLQNQEHISWQRLNRLPDPFWSELLVVIAEERRLADVRREIRIAL